MLDGIGGYTCYGVTIEFRDGGATGTAYITVPLAVGSTTPTFAQLDFSVPLPHFPSGLYVKVTGGTITGSVQVE